MITSVSSFFKGVIMQVFSSDQTEGHWKQQKWHCFFYSLKKDDTDVWFLVLFANMACSALVSSSLSRFLLTLILSNSFVWSQVVCVLHRTCVSLIDQWIGPYSVLFQCNSFNTLTHTLYIPCSVSTDEL